MIKKSLNDFIGKNSEKSCLNHLAIKGLDV